MWRIIEVQLRGQSDGEIIACQKTLSEELVQLRLTAKVKSYHYTNLNDNTSLVLTKQKYYRIVRKFIKTLDYAYTIEVFRSKRYRPKSYFRRPKRRLRKP